MLRLERPSGVITPYQMSNLFTTLYWFTALSYVVLMPALSQTNGMLLKAAPILFLLWPILRAKVTYTNWLIGACVFSAGGDVLLASNLPGQFVLGLSSFLVAHLAYVGAIRVVATQKPWPVSKVVGLALYGSALATLLVMHAENLALPVLLYAMVICTMAAFALKAAQTILIMGALLFVLSDSLIGINRFVIPFVWADIAIMCSYYLAQYLLIRSLITYATTRASA